MSGTCPSVYTSRQAIPVWDEQRKQILIISNNNPTQWFFLPLPEREADTQPAMWRVSGIVTSEARIGEERKIGLLAREFGKCRKQGDLHRAIAIYEECCGIEGFMAMPEATTMEDWLEKHAQRGELLGAWPVRQITGLPVLCGLDYELSATADGRTALYEKEWYNVDRKGIILFHPDMTGRENIYINATIFGLKKHEIDERLDDIIRFSELEEFIDSPVRTYSSGMYMRLAFSIAINVNAEILLIDEILAVGDANFQKKCFNKLEEIKKSGATIVIVSHTMSQIQSICDRAIWLDKGKIVEDGKASDVCGDYTFAMNQAAIAREQMENEQTGKEVVSNPTQTHPPVYEGRQCCRHAERMGSMRLRFHNIRLLNDEMQESQAFSYGDRMSLTFDLVAEKELRENESYSFKIGIYSNEDGKLCSSFVSKDIIGTYFHGIHSKCRFTIEHINLAGGDYFISLQMYLKPENSTDKDGELTDSIWHFVDFTIKPDLSLSTGVTAMKNEWHVSEE